LCAFVWTLACVQIFQFRAAEFIMSPVDFDCENRCAGRTIVEQANANGELLNFCRLKTSRDFIWRGSVLKLEIAIWSFPAG